MTAILCTPEVAAFLAKRLVGNAGDRGVSSDWMVAAAVVGQEPPADVYPHDLSDLHRCHLALYETPEKADELRRRMLAILTRWTNDLNDRVNPPAEASS